MAVAGRPDTLTRVLLDEQEAETEAVVAEEAAIRRFGFFRTALPFMHASSVEKLLKAGSEHDEAEIAKRSRQVRRMLSVLSMPTMVQKIPLAATLLPFLRMNASMANVPVVDAPQEAPMVIHYIKGGECGECGCEDEPFTMDQPEMLDQGSQGSGFGGHLRAMLRVLPNRAAKATA